MKIQELQGKKVLILGFSKEGQVTLKVLKERDPQLQICVADQGQPTEQALELLAQLHIEETYFGDMYLQALKSVDVVIKTPGITSLLPEIQEASRAGVVFTSATNIFFAEKKGKTIVVTGSKGKSTTTSLLYEMLKKHGVFCEIVGNIGRPMLEFLKDDVPEKVYVCELSSYQLEDLMTPPDIFVMVSFFPDHLDYHGGLDAYFHAKVQVTTKMSKQQKIYYNAAFDRLHGFFQRSVADTFPYNDTIRSTVTEDGIVLDGEMILPLEQLALRGRHNAENGLGACMVAKDFGVTLDEMREVLSTFQALAHRLQVVGTYQGITFIDDAISTTPESTIAAMRSFPGNIGCMILGGRDRGYDFRALANEVFVRNVPLIVLFPDSGEKIKNSIIEMFQEKNQPVPEFFSSIEMNSCIKKVYDTLVTNTFCILSCASPSYSIFKNFEEKGDLFQKCVRELSGDIVK